MHRGKSVWFTLLIGVMLITVSGVFFKGTEYVKPQNDTAGSGVPSLSGPPVDARSAELHIAVAMREEEFAVLQQKHQDYADSRPHHTYTLERLEPATAATDIRDRARTGPIPDIMLLPNTAIVEFAAMGYLVQVEDQLSGDNESTSVSSAVDAQVRWNGASWGIPVDIDPYLLVYRTGSGNLPEDATYAEVADWLEQASAGSPVAGEWLLPKQDPVLLAALGTHAFRQEGQAMETAPDDPADRGLQEEAEEWKHAIEGSLPVRFTTDSYETMLEQIAEGQALLAAVPLSVLNQIAGDESWKAAVLPKSKDGWTGSWQPGRSFAVSSNSVYQREAFEWVQAVNDASFQLALMEQGGGAPVSGSASPLYNSASHVSASVISAALSRMEAYGSAPSFYQQLTAVFRELELLQASGSTDWTGLVEAIEAVQRTFVKDGNGP